MTSEEVKYCKICKEPMKKIYGTITSEVKNQPKATKKGELKITWICKNGHVE